MRCVFLEVMIPSPRHPLGNGVGLQQVLIGRNETDWERERWVEAVGFIFGRRKLKRGTWKPENISSLQEETCSKQVHCLEGNMQQVNPLRSFRNVFTIRVSSDYQLFGEISF